MARSQGEEEYAAVFRFKEGVPANEHEELRDYLYKFAFNLNEAHEYLSLLKCCYDLDNFNESKLLYRIHGMSLQCFALCMRKITDNSSERSIRKLVNKATKPDLAKSYIDEITQIYKHYEKFLNKYVVHQDIFTIRDGILFFPNEDVILADLTYLTELYLTLVHEICTGYIDVTGEGEFYGFELEKLLD